MKDNQTVPATLLPQEPPPLAQCKSLDQYIARLAWEVEQPNTHPVELYRPLIEAIGRKLEKYGRPWRPAYHSAQHEAEASGVVKIEQN